MTITDLIELLEYLELIKDKLKIENHLYWLHKKFYK